MYTSSLHVHSDSFVRLMIGQRLQAAVQSPARKFQPTSNPEAAIVDMPDDDFEDRLLLGRGGVAELGKITASSNRVSLNCSYCWEYTKAGLHSGVGIDIVCPSDVSRTCMVTWYAVTIPSSRHALEQKA